MGWAGKIIGAIIGGSFGGIWGAIIGCGIGSWFDSQAESQKKEQKQQPKQQANATAQRMYITFLFSALAKLAKADGVVSYDEATVIKNFINEYFNDNQKAYIKQVFNRAKDDSNTFEFYLDNFYRAVRKEPEILQSFLALMCEIAGADGNICGEEWRMLRYAERKFGLNGYINAFFRLNGGGNSNTEYTAPDTLTGYYSVLGCKATDSDEVVKKAYREKCRRFHPDLLQSKGLPPELLESAKKEMQRINVAYDAIKKARGM